MSFGQGVKCQIFVIFLTAAEFSIVFQSSFLIIKSKKWIQKLLCKLSNVLKVRYIFERVFDVFDFLQKTNEGIRLYYYDTSSRLVFVRFLEETEDTKKPF